MLLETQLRSYELNNPYFVMNTDHATIRSQHSHGLPLPAERKQSAGACPVLIKRLRIYDLRDDTLGVDECALMLNRITLPRLSAAPPPATKVWQTKILAGSSPPSCPHHLGKILGVETTVDPLRTLKRAAGMSPRGAAQAFPQPRFGMASSL
jgi:hypothetical protein